MASCMLALCDMRTLYLRNVPDEVGERLERMAAREGLSASALAVRELSVASRRADNPALLADLPDLDVAPEEIVSGLDDGRAGR
jgi:plasmid stability protein